MWSEGNYPAIAEVLMPVARALVDACAISAGQEVLDVAAGTGNVAVVAAEEGASVVASDLTPTLIDLGRARSAEAGLDIEWVEADAEALPFEDARFDCVTSTFGAMFAPRPEVVARELFRVVRPGNTVGMANWTPEGFQVLDHERIKTTEAKAKAVKPEVEKLITLARRGDLHSRRQALAALGQDKYVVYKLFEEIAPRYAERPGGYLRILKLGPRKSDSSEMVFLELV
jgi:ribosomal protein L17